MPTDDQITAAHVQAQKACPSVNLSLIAFREGVQMLNVSEDGLSRSSADLYLAWAAGEGDSEAILTIERSYLSRLVGRLRRLGTGPDDALDVLQASRQRLFTGPNPRIRAYNGIAPLERWIRVIVVRTAIDMHRTRRGRDDAIPVSSGDDVVQFDPVRSMVQRAHKAEFEDLFRRGLASLSPRDRGILRLHLVEGISIEKIARAYRVHRVTVARWLWNAGEVVLAGFRRYFHERYGMAPSDCDSLAQLVKSQISLNLAELLPATEATGGDQEA